MLQVLEVPEGTASPSSTSSTSSTWSTYILAVLPPFAVPPIRFPFRALAARVGRAPLGGEREVAMAALMVARLAGDALKDPGMDGPARSERATAAKAWLASIAVPARARPGLARAFDATAGDRAVIVAAVEELAKTSAPWLDEASVAELRGVTAAPFVNSR
ncbi:MAG TPA: hypothetical protein VFQ66_00900 [Candidatus Limnocylindria bacterium]|nr:hypothetical protein [Candidatus Limnocylindria bacterium]